ncbi:hypothetical protein TNCV_4409141 [Trichonephila clavipes]|nr:hypothetical protein TNCV_4409141 [Trichonephila clavipes]
MDIKEGMRSTPHSMSNNEPVHGSENTSKLKSSYPWIRPDPNTAWVVWFLVAKDELDARVSEWNSLWQASLSSKNWCKRFHEVWQTISDLHKNTRPQSLP